MTDVWLFGEFACSNNNLDSNKTRDRLKAKWRSQYPVPSGSVAYGAYRSQEDNWVLINGNIHAVYISDLDYQLRKTDPITEDDLWLKYVNSGTVGGFFYIACFRLGGSAEFQELPPDSTSDEEEGNPSPFIKFPPTPKTLVDLQYLSFSEERLELGYDYGAIGGVAFSTEIIKVLDEREQRNANKILPLGRWQLGNRKVADSQLDQLEEISYIRSFHNRRLGSFQGFRFKDWSDFVGWNQLIAVGDGVTNRFQLKKAYRVGNAVTYRPIQKPVVGTVDLFVDGLNVAVNPDHGWIVDHQTGVIFNPAPLAVGRQLSANFEFDIPVWFEGDEISFSLEAYESRTGTAIYNLGSIYVVEGKIPLDIPFVPSPVQEITEILDLGVVYDTSEQYSFSTQSIGLRSGYTIRQNKRQTNKVVINLANKNYDADETALILAYFWNCRGMLNSFLFRNLGVVYRARFDQDQLNFKFEAAEPRGINQTGSEFLQPLDDGEKFFSLDGMRISLIDQ